MFILTGIIGVFQLFEGPKSVGAVTVAGGVASPSVGLPDRSFEATELPSWQPSPGASQTSETRTTSVVQKTVVATTQVPAPQSTTRTTTQTTQIPAKPSTQSASTTAPVISAKAVTTTAATQPKVTTSAPTVTTKPATTTAKATTTAPQPSQSVLKPTATAKPTTQPKCYRFLFFWICR
jgi:hypothetical protein